MSIVEVIGFIISVLSLIYISFKQAVNQSKQSIDQQGHRTQIQAKKQDKIPVHSSTSYPPKAPMKMKKTPSYLNASSSKIEKTNIKNQIEDKELKNLLEFSSSHVPLQKQVEIKQPYFLSTKVPYLAEKKILRPSRAALAVQRLIDPKDLIIYHEIMDQPKSMRPHL